MKKKLTAKIQELNPNLPQYSGSFSKCVIIEPESKEVAIRKGIVYAVFDIESEAAFDTGLVCKVLTDTIHNSYYQSENISPIQSMEKTITEVRERIVQLSSEILRADQPPAKFNIVTGVLWGNVLYVIQYGEMGLYYINTLKDNTVKVIPTISEGSFAAGSEVLTDENVVFFCTKSFEKEYPSEKFLTSRFSEQALKTNQACLLMKIIVDTNFSDDEVVDFGLQKALEENKTKLAAEKLTSSIKEVLNNSLTKISDKLRLNRKDLNKPTTYTTTLSTIALPKTETPKKKFSINPRMVKIAIPALALALAISIVLGLTSKNKKTDSKVSPNNRVDKALEVENKNSSATKEVLVSEEQTQKQKEEDMKNKVVRVKTEGFYDLKITDAEANPNDIEAFADTLVVSDKNTGKIYSSALDVPKLEAKGTIFTGIKSLTNTDGKLGFLDNNGYKFYDLKANKVTEEETFKADVAIPYTNYVYAISGDTLRKYNKDKLEGISWGQGTDFQNAKSMAIAYNIYVINQKSELVSYSQGKKTDFTIIGLDGNLKNPVKIIANNDFKYIYIADHDLQSVIVINDKGELIKQIKAEDDKSLNDIRSIAISPDEKILYLLNGTKILQANIQ